MTVKKINFSVRDFALISVLTAILFIQEQILIFIPNVQLTFLLIILYAKKLRLTHVVMIVSIYVLIDSLFTSSFGLVYTPYIYIGLMLIPVSLKTIFKKVESSVGLAFLSIIFSFIYCWLFFIPFVLIMKVDFIAYLTADILFEVILVASNFLAVIILYDPISKLFEELIKKYINNKEKN